MLWRAFSKTMLPLGIQGLAKSEKAGGSQNTRSENRLYDEEQNTISLRVVKLCRVSENDLVSIPSIQDATQNQKKSAPDFTRGPVGFGSLFYGEVFWRPGQRG